MIANPPVIVTDDFIAQDEITFDMLADVLKEESKQTSMYAGSPQPTIEE